MNILSLDEQNGITTLKVKAALSKGDFKALAEEADHYIDTHGDMNGLIIMAEHFPGWENFGGMVSHVKFVKNHHKHIKKIAFVTESRLLGALPSMTSHFVSADVKAFELNEEDKAKEWILAA